jgi:hypothetical protein
MHTRVKRDHEIHTTTGLTNRTLELSVDQLCLLCSGPEVNEAHEWQKHNVQVAV